MLPCATCWNGDGFLVCYSYSRHRHLDVDFGRSAACHSCCAGVVVARRRSLRHLRAARCRGSLGSPRPPLCRDWTHPSPHLCRDWARPAHIRAGTGLADATPVATCRARAAWGRGPSAVQVQSAGVLGVLGQNGAPPCDGLTGTPTRSRRCASGTHAVLTRCSRGTHAVLTRCANGTLRRVRERTLLERRTRLYTTDAWTDRGQRATCRSAAPSMDSLGHSRVCPVVIYNHLNNNDNNNRIRYGLARSLPSPHRLSYLSIDPSIHPPISFLYGLSIRLDPPHTWVHVGRLVRRGEHAGEMAGTRRLARAEGPRRASAPER